MKDKRILIVEDEEHIRRGLVDVLVFHGFEVVAVDNGLDGLKEAQSRRFDAIILDIMLPGMDGYGVCEEIRQKDKRVPIVMLTAKSTEDDVIEGLSLGADDYIKKPFSVRELVLRIEAILRRSGPEKPEQLELGSGVIIDFDNLKIAGEKEQPLTEREADIIAYLAKNHHRPVSREELLTEVWDYRNAELFETRTVDIHIAKIRKKIERDSSSPENLVTVRAKGYKLVIGSESESA